MASVERGVFSIGSVSAAASTRYRASKFAAPPPPTSYVPRPRLVARLNAATHARLTVVSGRAGAGKTALVSNWASTIDERDRTWITLDADDNRASTFWSTVDVALHHLGENRFDQFRRMNVERDAFLVLDDGHVLTGDDGRNSLADLVALLPQWMHLVVVCRDEPALSLWRLRAAGDVFEIGDDDLRLSADEAAKVVADGNMSSVDIVRLHERTEGWITGLKLMAAAQASDACGEDVVREFLWNEVFLAQSAHVQRFLLETSCLARLTPALCEHVTGRPDASELLHHLERANTFVSRDPEQYGVYRCHAQFRALLADELDARDPDRARAIHAAAARWFEERDDAATAVEHWVAAGSVNDAVRLLPEAHISPSDANHDDLIRALLARVHPSMGATDVWRLLDYATALATVDQDDALSDVLDHVDAILEVTPDDAAAFRAEFLRGLLHVGKGEVEEMVAALERAEKQLSERPALAHDSRLGAGPRLSHLYVWLGHGYRWLERPRDARRMLERVPPATVGRGDIHFRDSARAAAAFASGYLDDARKWTARAIERARQLGENDDITARAAYQVHAGLLAEQNDLALARLVVDAMLQQQAGATTSVFAITTRLALADLLRVEGNVAESLELLRELRLEHPQTHGTTVDNWFARSAMFGLIAIGRIDGARAALGSPPYPAALATAAALLELADDAPELAAQRIEGMQIDTPRRLLVASLIRARVAEACDDGEALERNLHRVLRLGMRQGFIRTVVDLAPNLLDSLHTICASPDESEYVARLRQVRGRTLGIVNRDHATVEAQLSPRELEVLSYLPTQLSTREIADALHVSINTVKTHMQSVYRKLGSESRDSAVERARVLQLLR